ncbi:MAG: rhodanese-like domain-containing protein [Planctomycetota bacterium]
MAEELPLEISCEEVHTLRESREELTLVDCRQPEEHAIVHLAGSTLVPMGDVPSRVAELAAAPGRLVVYCHHGMRSAQTAAWLRENGAPGAQSMAGGVDAWAERIDPSLARY